MPVELVEKGRSIARERCKCPHCGSEIRIKFAVKTKEALYVHGASDSQDGIIECYECQARLKWTPPSLTNQGEKGMTDVQERLRTKFLRYAQRLKKTDPQLAEKITAKVDKLVAWYVENQRDLTLEEFHRILDA